MLVGSLATLAMIPVYFLLAIPTSLVPIMVASLAGGVGVEVFSVMWDTAMQEQIPHDRLSRVYSYDALGSFVCIPIGLSVAGPLSDLLGVGAALVFGGCVELVSAGLVLTVHDVRTLRRTDRDDPELLHEPSLIPEPTP